MMDGYMNDTSNQMYIILIRSFCKRPEMKKSIMRKLSEVEGTFRTGRYDFENQFFLGDTGT